MRTGKTDLQTSEGFVKRILANPLGNVGARFADERKVRVEFVGHDSLVLPVVVADAEMPFGDDLNIDRPAIFEREVQSREQGIEVVFRLPDDNGILAAAQLSEAALDQRPSSQVRHIQLTLPRALRVAA